jgi:FkbM family methyltransferase
MGVLRDLARRAIDWWHAPAHWRFRPGTIDRRIFREVVISDEYRLPRLGREDLVVDVGAHIGSFALAALRRGAGRVVCCEPDAASFEALCHNLAPYKGRAALVRCAAWGSDVPSEGVRLHNPIDPRNTGAVQARLDGPGEAVSAVPLDDLLRVVARGQRVRLLKLDCEGAEWPILFSSSRLGEVDEVVGEYHLPPLAGPWAGLPWPTEAALLERLAEMGFTAEAQRCPRSPLPVGSFRAVRRALTPAA